MSATLPRSFAGFKRSGFSLIDPETELYHHKVGRAEHVAISYVWGDWTDDPEAGHHLRHWPELRRRLLKVVGPGASTFMKICSGHARHCWLDCKCIDQGSAADKSYWVPRMDEIYSDARCTVLLLRSNDVSFLQEAESRLACDVDHDQHSCLLTQTCASIQLDAELEGRVMDALQTVYSGAWRQRAWIFQEILLSKEYVLADESGGEVKLSDVGTIAYLLFRKDPSREWLGELASWCRRLWRLRSYYGDYSLCPSNVLQMAASLKATLPCDKYYALCGVLRLKGIEYNSADSEAQALQAVLMELSRKGRLTWLSALPPSPPGLNNRLITDRAFLPFIDNRLHVDAAFYAQVKVVSSPAAITFTCFRVGTVVSVTPLADLLAEALQYANDEDITTKSMPARIAAVPSLLLRVCRDVIAPLVAEPILSRICRVLNVQPKNGGATVIMKLLALDNSESLPDDTATTSNDDIDSALDRNLVCASSWALQHHVTKAAASLDCVTWTTNAHKGQPGTENHALGAKGSCAADDKTDVLTVRHHPLLLAVGRPEQNTAAAETTTDPEPAVWKTVLQQAANKEASFSTPGGVFGSLLPMGHAWKTKRKLTFYL